MADHQQAALGRDAHDLFRWHRRQVEVTPEQVLMIVRKDDDLAGLDLDRLPVRDLRRQPPLDDIVVEHEVLGTFEQRAAVLSANLRQDAPGRSELRMQEDAALQTNHPQHV